MSEIGLLANNSHKLCPLVLDGVEETATNVWRARAGEWVIGTEDRESVICH